MLPNDSPAGHGVPPRLGTLNLECPRQRSRRAQGPEASQVPSANRTNLNGFLLGRSGGVPMPVSSSARRNAIVGFFLLPGLFYFPIRFRPGRLSDAEDSPYGSPQCAVDALARLTRAPGGARRRAQTGAGAGRRARTCGGGAPRPNGEATRLLRSPTVSATQIAFAYANNIWVVERVRRPRKTFDELSGANVSNPHFSPDGRSVAFSGEYAGNTDVYVVPSDGGEPGV